MTSGGSLALLAAAAVQFVIPPPSPPPIPLADISDLAIGNAEDRMTVPVQIKARGPWDFIIDTGAERTVISRELAGVLGLPAGPDVRVTAMTGTSRVGTVIVPALRVSTIAQETIQAPALAAANLGAAGLLGVDSLQGHKVGIDFDRNRMTLQPSRKRASRTPADRDAIVITARSLFGQLIVTDARYRGKKISVVIDTGSPLSIGNSAFFRLAGGRARPLGTLSTVSVTGGVLTAAGYAIDDISIGGIGFRNVRVAIADAPPFRRFGLEGKPALLLGMETMRLFRNVQIDFANREIRFTLPRGLVAETEIRGL